MAQYLVMALIDTELQQNTVMDHARLALVSDLAFKKTGKVAVCVIGKPDTDGDPNAPDYICDQIAELEEELDN